MGKTMLILLFCFIVILAIPMAQCVELGPKAVEEWFEKIPHAKQKLTKFHFYYHDVVSGKNPTAITIAQPNTTAKPHFFRYS